MSKNPFDYVKSINNKENVVWDKFKYEGYNAFLTNRCFAMHIDTVLLAEEMNQSHRLTSHLQYKFYYFSVRRGKRFGFPPKPPEEEHLRVICEYYQCSEHKAREYLRLLTPDQIQAITDSMDTGGR